MNVKRENQKKQVRDKPTLKSSSEEKNTSIGHRQKVLFYEPKPSRAEEAESLFNIPSSEEVNPKSK